MEKVYCRLELKVLAAHLKKVITKAAPYHIDEILALTKACAKAMIQLGIYQWNEHYPSKERLLQDIEDTILLEAFKGQKPDKIKEFIE